MNFIIFILFLMALLSELGLPQAYDRYILPVLLFVLFVVVYRYIKKNDIRFRVSEGGRGDFLHEEIEKAKQQEKKEETVVL